MSERDPVREAEWYYEAGRLQDVLDVLREADPNDPRVAYIRGRALIETGRPKEGEEVALRGLAIAPENVLLLELLANAQMIEDAFEAEVTLRKALAIEPEKPGLLGLYVVILLLQERYEWAEKMLARLMRIAPDDQVTHRVRATFMLKAAGSGSARAAARDFLHEFPDDAFAHYLQGLAQLSGAWWRGLRHLREAARLRPQEPVLVETARVMTAWWLWPVHLTSGAVHWVLSISAWIWMLVGLAGDDGRFFYLLAALFAYTGYKFGAMMIARTVMEKRIARALREMY